MATTGSESAPADLDFLSSCPLDDSTPGTTWRDLRHPRLRKFRLHDQPLRFTKYLGHGIDGAVFRVHFGESGPYAMKVFWRTSPHVAPPGWNPRLVPYWAFEHECRNTARLEKIRWAYDQSTRPIYMSETVDSYEEARGNLFAVSDEAREQPRKYRNRTSLSSIPNITKCHGWMSLPRTSLPRLWHRKLQYDYPDEVDTAEYNYAILYEYVDDGPEDTFEISRHLSFFYAMGFSVDQYYPRNWRSGRLVDFCDIFLWDKPLRWKKKGRKWNLALFLESGKPLDQRQWLSEPSEDKVG